MLHEYNIWHYRDDCDTWLCYRDGGCVIVMGRLSLPLSPTKADYIFMQNCIS